MVKTFFLLLLLLVLSYQASAKSASIDALTTMQCYAFNDFISNLYENTYRDYPSETVFKDTALLFRLKADRTLALINWKIFPKIDDQKALKVLLLQEYAKVSNIFENMFETEPETFISSISGFDKKCEGDFKLKAEIYQ